MHMQRAGDWDSDCGPASAATVAPRYYPLCRYFIFHLCDKQVAKILLEKGIRARSSRVFHASRSLRSGVSRKLPRHLLRRLCAAPPDRARLTAPSVPGPPLDSAAFFAALFLARCWLSCVDEFDAVRPCGETSSS